MNILSAIFAGQTGFLRATQSMASRAQEIAQNNDGDDSKLAENLIGLKVDKAFANANTKTITVAGSLLNEFVRDATKK